MQDAVFFDRSEQKCSYHGGLNAEANLPENMPGGKKSDFMLDGTAHVGSKTDFFWPLRSYRYPFR